MSNKMSRQTVPANHRPATRRLIDLTNTELSLLFERRAEDLRKELHGHSFWDSEYIVYWIKFSQLQFALFEVMMEIQSRYPAEEISSVELLPVKEPRKL